MKLPKSNGNISDEQKPFFSTTTTLFRYGLSLLYKTLPALKTFLLLTEVLSLLDKKFISVRCYFRM